MKKCKTCHLTPLTNANNQVTGLCPVCLKIQRQVVLATGNRYQRIRELRKLSQ